jgi:tripartite-type tricarboxylate transporter receptor subunit TctC
MKVSRRTFLYVAAAAAAVPCLRRVARAQAYPTRPITLVVPFAAGGSFDVIARVLTPGLSEILGQQVIVENVGAASGIVGVNRVAHAMPDGYSVLLGTVGTHAYNPALYKKLPYKPAADFTPGWARRRAAARADCAQGLYAQYPAGVHYLCQGQRN